MRDKQNRGGIFIRIAVAFDGEIAAVAHDVCIGHDAVAVDDEAGADAATDDARIPGRLVIGLDLGRGDADKTLLDRSVRPRRSHRDHDGWRGRAGWGANLAWSGQPPDAADRGPPGPQDPRGRSGAALAEAEAGGLCCRASTCAAANNKTQNKIPPRLMKSEKMKRCARKANCIPDGEASALRLRQPQPRKVHFPQ